MASDREYINENMPTLPDGYYFKVTRPIGGYGYTKLMRKRSWWFDKRIARVINRQGELNTPERVVQEMKDFMRIHGGGIALAADQNPKSRLTGRYAKRAVPMLPIVANPDRIEYDEGTQTFTLSEEILERLKNGI